jgi:hypothetical protein
MFRSSALTLAMSAVLFASITSGALLTQESSNQKSQTTDSIKPTEAYKLDFSVGELEDGKRINTRLYSMNLNSNDRNEIKIGTRVPVEESQGQFTYIDVGTNIEARLSDLKGPLELSVRAEISNFAMPDQASGHEAHPIIRQLRISASTLVVPGRPMIIGSVDDPNSKRQFQLEVTATRLK